MKIPICHKLCGIAVDFTLSKLAGMGLVWLENCREENYYCHQQNNVKTLQMEGRGGYMLMVFLVG